jgi:hypothetical protein
MPCLHPLLPPECHSSGPAHWRDPLHSKTRPVTHLILSSLPFLPHHSVHLTTISEDPQTLRDQPGLVADPGRVVLESAWGAAASAGSVLVAVALAAAALVAAASAAGSAVAEWVPPDLDPGQDRQGKADYEVLR